MCARVKSWLFNILFSYSRKKNKVAVDLRATVMGTSFEGNNTVQKECQLVNCRVGKYTYVSRSTRLAGCIIGRFCSIAPQVENIGGEHPVKDFVSTHPIFYSKRVSHSFVDKDKYQEYKWIDSDKKIQNIIGNDVWIGTGATIMEGIIIGDGAVIAANAHVVKNVPPYAIVGGNPAKIIKYRFEQNQIEKLLKIQWWNMDEQYLRDHADLFSNVDEFLKYIEILDCEETKIKDGFR